MFFFFNDTATTEIYTLSLHDALPICRPDPARPLRRNPLTLRRALPHVATCGNLASGFLAVLFAASGDFVHARSEEHTSELQSRQYLVCRLLLEKKKKDQKSTHHNTSE